MIEAMKLALEALENNPYALAYSKVITSLRQAIEQAEKQRHEFVCGECVKCGASIEKQEPVAWMYDRAKYRENDMRGRQWAFKCVSQTKPYMDEMVRNVTPLYTVPQPQREWVGLTEEEVNELEEDQTLETTHDFISAIEAKLKEKNGL